MPESQLGWFRMGARLPQHRIDVASGRMRAWLPGGSRLCLFMKPSGRCTRQSKRRVFIPVVWMCYTGDFLAGDEGIKSGACRRQRHAVRVDKRYCACSGSGNGTRGRGTRPTLPEWNRHLPQSTVWRGCCLYTIGRLKQEALPGWAQERRARLSHQQQGRGSHAERSMHRLLDHKDGFIL